MPVEAWCDAVPLPEQSSTSREAPFPRAPTEDDRCGASAGRCACPPPLPRLAANACAELPILEADQEFRADDPAARPTSSPGSIPSSCDTAWAAAFSSTTSPAPPKSSRSRRWPRARPDGHTLMIGNISTNGLTPILLAKKMKIDYERDVQIITPLADVPVFFLATTTNFQPATFGDFLAYAEEHPHKVRYGSAGIGSHPADQHRDPCQGVIVLSRGARRWTRILLR